ncbi:MULTISPECIES: MoxR family ATPase [unclassified Arenibacter]|jgi:MoxR-like ATPase|uniref:AAA family ATPase n=1 Tax=unclassified Arenibacter TaxID=2615047 RepID=UPI000E34B257|nr:MULTISPECIES: MoxR family ATPase [unclassified Arenibacter]MCM4165227.1 magnesium chelatase [Arenibacter sp. A80]RFT55083.1 MoxR family ATPase [Arenibacter sp. P308M17]
MEESRQGEGSSPLEFKNRIDLGQLQASVAQVKTELERVIIGQRDMIELLIISILANGHSLIEGVPGVAKTVTAKLLAKTMNVAFSRIQFTPDLMPSDILGTSIFNVKTSEFEFKKGPLFSNIILIDEINRAPAKTQAALFEAMAERQITMDGQSYEMSSPFLVFATQNPIEQEGTYRLPEAQLDRFLFKIKVDYPSLEEEVAILESKHRQKNKNLESLIGSVLTADQIASYQEVIGNIIIEDNLMKYIAAIVHNTRNNANLYLGASPRASIAIMDASKALAAIQGRDFVTPDDIKKVAAPILGHRVILTPEREMEGFTSDKVIQQIMDTIEIPR